MSRQAPPGRIKVWDPFVRLFHWTLALSFALAWFSAKSWDDLHIWAGYAAGSLVVLRLVWGIIGARFARFSQFVRTPGKVLDYLKAVAVGREARYIGHNPAGGAMVIALLLTILATALSGWALTTDAFWGDSRLQRLHDGLAHVLLLLVFAHWAGVALASFRHKENLVGAMVGGQKRAPGPQDVV
jgi:cytochrome b